METFKDRLRVAAQHKGIEFSQSAIARSLGLKRQSVDNWFNGREPSLENLRLLASAWEIDAGWLATGTGEMVPTTSKDPLSQQERDIIRQYRSAGPKQRELLRTLARQLGRAVTVALFLLLPPPPADAAQGIFTLHNKHFTHWRRLFRWMSGSPPSFRLTFVS